MTERADIELLRGWRAGDNEAGNELVVRHYRTVHRFLQGKADDVVDDLIQRTFLACLEALERLREEASFKPFLLGIARRQLLLHYRERNRSIDANQLVNATVEQLAGSPSAIVAERERQRIVLAALRRIPLDLQLTAELYYWEEMSVAEVATVMEVAPGTVKSRLSRARELLEDQIRAMSVPAALRQSSLEHLRSLTSRRDDEG